MEPCLFPLPHYQTTHLVPKTSLFILSVLEVRTLPPGGAGKSPSTFPATGSPCTAQLPTQPHFSSSLWLWTYSDNHRMWSWNPLAKPQNYECSVPSAPGHRASCVLLGRPFFCPQGQGLPWGFVVSEVWQFRLECAGLCAGKAALLPSSVGWE